MQSRQKSSKINLSLAMIKYIISIITAFVLRTMALQAFGDVFSGLISLYSNVISVLSISELGIGTALIYKLYKPVAENDNERVKTLLGAYKKIYFVISFIILGLGLLVLPFLKILTQDANYTDGNIYIIFLFYLFNCIITYYVGHRKALLFTMQKNWVENLAFSIATIIIFPVQIIVLLFVKNCYVYLFCTTIILFIECLVITLLSNKKYREIRQSNTKKLSKEDKKELVKNTYAMSCNKIASVAFKGVDSLIISAFLGVVSVFLYSNYYLILTYLFAILNLVFGALKASVGNYVNTMPKEKVRELFDELNLGFYLIICFCSVLLFCLYQPFMNWWGSVAGKNLILPLAVPVLMTLYFYLDCNRKIVHIFKETNGVFWKDRYVPIISSIINIILSIILVQFIGLEGVILATVVSVLLQVVVEVNVTYKEVFSVSSKQYWLNYLLKLLLFVSICGISYFISNLIIVQGVLGLILKLMVCSIITISLNVALFIRTKPFKNLVKRVIKLKK